MTHLRDLALKMEHLIFNVADTTFFFNELEDCDQVRINYNKKTTVFMHDIYILIFRYISMTCHPMTMAKTYQPTTSQLMVSEQQILPMTTLQPEVSF